MLVIYRACSTGSIHKERPIEGKINLVRACFKSFKKAFRGVDCELICLLDKPSKDLREIFKGEETEETFYENFHKGNTGSFHRQIDLALEKEKDFLFVEDDYYFLPGSGKSLVKAIKQFDFVTPYLHPGYFSENRHGYLKSLRLIDDQVWANVLSTTLTFGGKYKALKKEHLVMKQYGWADEPMWNNITQRFKLWTPIPTLATHMETPHLSPGVMLKTLQAL